MEVDVKLNSVSEIETRIGIQEKGPAHAYLTERCFVHMTQFVPGGESSHLNQNIDLQVDSITYQSPDAHYLHTGEKYIDPIYKVGGFPIRGGKISFNPADGPIEGFVSRRGIAKVPSGEELNYHTPGTGAHWDSLMWTAKGQEVTKEVQAYVDRGCK